MLFATKSMAHMYNTWLHIPLRLSSRCYVYHLDLGNRNLLCTGCRYFADADLGWNGSIVNHKFHGLSSFGLRCRVSFPLQLAVAASEGLASGADDDLTT